ncbi:oligosaccharide flippase family protein [Solirubrobacter sp. CPCC 204708]|uniref:Oligosaccharide flippase family protein n=1 Tax=Solirubrobacter deserti TaxID=2282478 RepID=A0ABT4RN43_9ACTN|nr:oligosaccharide flippase family protein [Solirubrobacter deserti]MBE2317405.1 oligosaccharide flippase family protein [Solirubrobacter deserti]MDA0139987.1 oligosaccharide flippase family protein [Solirubrobacter deserti]
MSRGLSRNVAANMVNAGATILSSVLTVPIVLHFVGLDGFGVWTLAQTALVYVATAETGFGPAVQRYVSVARGAGTLHEATRVVWSAAVFYVLLGAVIAVATVLAAPTIVDLFDVPGELRADAIAMFELVGPVMLLTLLVSGLANVQQGMERFISGTVATAVSVLVFLSVGAALLAAGRGLRGLAEAALAQFAVAFVMRSWMVRDVLTAGRPALVTRAQARELISFSARMQVNVISTLVNSQTDKLVVGLISNTATMGAVGIASQLAEAMRFLVGASLGPFVSRFSTLHGQRAEEQLARLYHRIAGVWLRMCAGLTLIALVIMVPLVDAWLGDEAGDTALYALPLTAAYGVNLMAGVAFAYLRAVGKPGAEAGLGGIVIILNVVLTVTLGVLFGPFGVVFATLAAYVAGTIWFFARIPGLIPPDPGTERPSSAKVAAAGVASAVLAGGWALLMAALLPTGYALVPLLAGAGLAFAGFVAVAAGGVRGLVPR